MNVLTCEVVAGAIIFPNFSYERLGRADQDGRAVFGEVTVGLTDRLAPTVGVRQHDQENSAHNTAISPNAAPLTDDIMGYISCSEGFDCGGISNFTTNSGRIFIPNDPQTVSNSSLRCYRLTV